MRDVQHIERRPSRDGIEVVMKTSTWNHEITGFNNSVRFCGEEAKKFVEAWCQYRSELEADTLDDLSVGVIQTKTETGLRLENVNLKALLLEFAEDIECTGGLVENEELAYLAPAADTEWVDLAETYLKVCSLLHREPKIER